MRWFSTASEFYQSPEWRSLRSRLMSERTGEDGLLRCEHCGKPILRSSDCTAHHVREIDSANLNDPEVTLNPANISLVHIACHNEIHRRFGGRVKPWQRKVYCVFGAPLSGKSTFVRERMERGDLVLDMDSLWEALGNLPSHGRAYELSAVVFPVRDLILDKVATRAGAWGTAWVISAEAYPGQRERMLQRLGAEEIVVEATREECLERLEADPEGRDYKTFKDLIETWFRENPGQREGLQEG